MADPLLVAALNAADTQLAGAYEGVDEWYVGHLDDHIYPTCPALKRSGHPIRRGQGRLYPEAGDVCGWCVGVWRARRAKNPHLAKCREATVEDPDATDGVYGCDTGCEYAVFKAVVSCPHGEREKFRWGDFGEIATILEEFEADETSALPAEEET